MTIIQSAWKRAAKQVTDKYVEDTISQFSQSTDYTKLALEVSQSFAQYQMQGKGIKISFTGIRRLIVVAYLVGRLTQNMEG